jgi:hypothetical protein
VTGMPLEPMPTNVLQDRHSTEEASLFRCFFGGKIGAGGWEPGRGGACYMGVKRNIYSLFMTDNSMFYMFHRLLQTAYTEHRLHLAEKIKEVIELKQLHKTLAKLNIDPELFEQYQTFIESELEDDISGNMIDQAKLFTAFKDWRRSNGRFITIFNKAQILAVMQLSPIIHKKLIHEG